jgi:predicted nucleotide-binding protein
MNKWTGTFEDLQAIAAGANAAGEWREIDDNQVQFRARDGGVMSWWRSTGRVLFQGPTAERDGLRDAMSASLAEFQSVSGTAKPQAPKGKQIFVVHGHDPEAREQLELVLHRLRLSPFVLLNTAGGGLTIIEALERQIGVNAEAEFGIVLFTADDMGYGIDEGATAAKPRARQNVVLELGMLMSSLGRDKVVMVIKGFVDLPSDAQGIIYLRFEKHIKEIVPKLAERLHAAGFPLRPEDVTAACS